MTLRRIASSALLAVCATLTACGSADDQGGAADPATPATTATTASVVVPAGPPTSVPNALTVERPPALVLRPDGKEVALKAWTACWGNGCFDGSPGMSGPIADVGSPSAVPIWFPEAGMRWTVTFVEGDDDRDCARHISHVVRPRGHDAVIQPAGPAGRYQVNVFGRAPSGGDVSYSFYWTTPADGSNPPAASGAATVLATDDGELTSYGVELAIRDLAEHPGLASARITVTSSAGREATLDLGHAQRCSEIGNVYFSRPDGSAATRIGEGPFTYDVDLTLDGRHYRGTGIYTHGSRRIDVPLTWEPALPSYEVDEH